MMKMTKKRSERGQALTEMAASLVIIVSLLLGFFLIASSGLQKVKNAILLRAETDGSSGGAESMKASIRLPEENDDNFDGSVFTNELVSNEREVNLVTDEELKYNNKFYGMPSHNTLLYAADLSHTERSVDDPLKEYGLDGTKEAISKLFGVHSMKIHDELYMPSCQQ